MSEGGINIAQQKTLPDEEWRQIHDALRAIRQALPADREGIYIQRREQLPERLRERFDSEYYTAFGESYEGEFNESSVNENDESGEPDEAVIEKKIERLQAQRTELQQLRDKAKEDLIVRFGNRGERVPGTRGFAWYEASSDSMYVVRGDGVIQEIPAGDSSNFGNKDNPNWKKWLGRKAGGWVDSSEDEIKIAKRKAWEQRQSAPLRDVEQRLASSRSADLFLEQRPGESDAEFLARLEKRLASEEGAGGNQDPALGSDIQKQELGPEKTNLGVKMRRRKSDGAWMLDEKGTGDYQLAVAGKEYIGKKNNKEIRFTFSEDLRRFKVLGDEKTDVLDEEKVTDRPGLEKMIRSALEQILGGKAEKTGKKEDKSTPQAPAEKTLEDDLGEMFGERDGLVIYENVRSSAAKYGRKVVLEAAKGALKMSKVTDATKIREIQGVFEDFIEGRRSDAAEIALMKTLSSNIGFKQTMRKLASTIDGWRAEEDEAFVHEILLNPQAGIDMTFAPKVLLNVLATPMNSEQEIAVELQNKLGSAAHVFARQLYTYTHGRGAGTREAELLERAEFFGMTDAEVEAIIARERGR